MRECEWVGVSSETLPIPAVALEEVIENPHEIPRRDDGTMDVTEERMVVEIDLPKSG